MSSNENMSSNDEMLGRLASTLETSARQIDVTFAQAGGRLGEGLSLFEGLKQRLSGLSEELAGDEIGQAGQALADLARTLRGLGRALPAETAALQSLAEHGWNAEQALDRLLDHMRLITILARSARIEAVSVQSNQRDFVDFTSEIVSLTAQAKQTVDICARDQQRLGALLRAALSAQRDFESRYGQVLTTLAARLEATLAELESRQASSVAMTGQAAVHSGKIAMAAGGAIIALQSGDSIRQRLEHAIAGLRLAREVAQGATGLDTVERAAAQRVVRDLEAAQLSACAHELANDALSIESVLALLADDTAGLLDLVQTLYGGSDASASFMADLDAGLAEAAAVLGKCDAARAGVDRVTSTVAEMIDSCHRTVTTLAGTVSSIVLIGMNAGLRAARLGPGGRSLVIISQELKTAADLIARDAERLTPDFAAMQQASAGLKDGDGRDAGALAVLDATLQRSLATMRATGDRLGQALASLTHDGGGFAGVIAEARLAFSNAAAMSDAITGAAVQLGAGAAGAVVPGAAAPAVSALLKTSIWPSYTMAAEREIHRRVLAQAGLDEAAAPVLVAAADPVDDLLF